MDPNYLLNCRKPEGKLGEKMIHSMNQHHELLARWGVSHLDINDNDIILDIGCGGGINIKRFTKMTNNKVYGLDYSKVSVNESIKHNQEEIADNKVEVHEGSVSDIPFDCETFDMISGFETIYFWPNIEYDFKEVYRVLRKGGKFFICNDEKLCDDTYERMGEIIKILDMNVYSEDELCNILSQVGFRHITSYTRSDNPWICIIAEK
ncbi:SAM-dependent methyltransferase [Methanosphaera sp. WGK6]|nr:SAM-dependent methyltransferase [Methanosphaera sp. WGK6]